MSSTNKSNTLIVTNMTCTHCESAIENELTKEMGIISVNAKYSSGKVNIAYDEKVIGLSKIIEVIEQAGYQVNHEMSEQQTGKIIQNNNIAQKKNTTQATTTMKRDYSDVIGVIVIIFAIYMVAKRFGLFDLLYQFPVAKESMGYGMLFVIGLLTSVHCVAMCGGICLSQCVNANDSTKAISKWAALKPSLLYNLGRVISYTVIGGIVGALGSVITFSGTMKGIVQILAGVFMVIMGINMLGVFPVLRKFNPRMPKIFAKKIYEQKQSNSPLYIGLLNGLMPCGPLQAMQIYAFSTGSPITGALSMFLFSIGTVPLLFAFGAISSFLSKKFTSKMMMVSAVLVIVLGLFMFNYGANLSGIVLPGSNVSSNSAKTENIAKVEDGIQTITTGLSSGRYEPIVVQKGTPVKWIIQAEDGDINGCNNTIIIPKLGIRKKLEVGDNVIEFTATDSGTIGYSCWMGMIRSNITVVDNLKDLKSSTIPENNSQTQQNTYDTELAPDTNSQTAPGGCCAVQ